MSDLILVSRISSPRRRSPQMTIGDILSPVDTADLRASDKARLLWQLAQRAQFAVGLPAELIANELLKREELGSTGVGHGVAIPHTRLQALKRPFGFLARLRPVVDFAAIDGKPVDLVFLLLLPTDAGGEQLNALACVSRKLRDPDVLARLRSTSGVAALYRTMVDSGNGA